jgi:hypothetical protein
VRRLSRDSGTSFSTVVDGFKEHLRKNKHRFVFEPKHYPKPATRKGVFQEGHTETAALVLSDWHGGSKIRLEETNGMNQYSSIIMANRANAVLDKFKRIFRGHQTMYSFDKIWVPILGDMVNGSIHPELILTNDLLDVPAAILVARLLIIALLELKTLGVPIEADCVVGNHPRLLVKMPAKRQAHLSYDWLIYTMVEQYFENDPKVTIRVHTGQFGLVEIMGHRFVVEHGYGAKDSTLPERLRKMYDSPVYRAATGLEGTAVDYVVIGDKHQAKDGPGYMVNGALTGSDEYGMSLRLSPIGAIQQMFGVCKSKIKTFHYELDVTNVISETPDNSMSTYATTFMKEHGR